MYNLNKIYPQFDRYAFNREKERWSKANHKGKINRITPDYNSHPDNRMTDTIEDIDKAKRNQAKDKRAQQEEKMLMQELQEMVLEENGDVNFNNMYRDIKMEETRENMNFNSLGEIAIEEDPDAQRLYHVKSDSSDNENEQEGE
mmetsp:Transcript_4081/g.3408  ORF Transcript_4081/g.3408 Transcript_4081/m.3408 type:complete len:144 (-) Transcript_4081:40-471(-)